MRLFAASRSSSVLVRSRAERREAGRPCDQESVVRCIRHRARWVAVGAVRSALVRVCRPREPHQGVPLRVRERLRADQDSVTFHVAKKKAQ